MNDNIHFSVVARAKRVRYVREDLLRLTRDKFSQLTGISVNTLQNWEQARNKGLTEESAKRLLQAYRHEGIECSLEWLLFGMGEKPTSPFDRHKIIPSKNISENENITKELQFFQELNGDVISTTITDDSMSPCFWTGDIVAGKRYTDAMMNKAIGLPSIVELPNGIMLVRMLEIGSKPGLFNLSCANPHTLLKKLLEDIELISATPVLWMRRKMLK